MKEKHLLQMIGINTDDWEKTPPSVRRKVVQLGSYVEELEQALKELQESKQQLEEQGNCNSNNSHSPPSSDLCKSQKNQKKKKGGKKRGGQPGYEGQSLKLYPVEECCLVTNHYPEICRCCGERLAGSDPNPYRHQIGVIPPIQLHIEEHRLHQLSCDPCGEKTRASLPESVADSGYGAPGGSNSSPDEWDVSPFPPDGGLSYVRLLFSYEKLNMSDLDDVLKEYLSGREKLVNRQSFND